ncbi:MAG TPA: SusD/RagB family nutrient-binding outer membrane lipoprotein [Puia sp.]
MKKITLLFICFLCVLTACKKNIASLNVDTKSPVNVPSYTLFSYAQKNLTDLVTTPDQLINVFRLLTQQWTETTYTMESNYQLDASNIPQTWWGVLYRDVLNNLEQAKKLIPAAMAAPAVERNQLAITDIMEVYAYSILVNTYGNIPYKQALNPTLYPTPEYEDAKYIYYDLLTRLDTSIAALDPASGSFGTADLILQGDAGRWKLFANSLKLRMAMLIADIDPATAKTKVEQAVSAGVLQSNQDNISFQYLSAPPNTNPLWNYFVQTGRIDIVVASTLADSMNKLNDPRIPFYFTTDASGVNYSGAIPGKNNTFANFSKPSAGMTMPGYPSLYIDDAETEFLLAEAVARGMNVGGSVESHYNSAIKASVLYWGGSLQQALDYLANPKVAYATAAGSSFKEKIALQKWIALYNRGFEAWTEMRRFNYPTPIPPVSAISGFPVRFRYPSGEPTTNGGNYTKASAAIGGDLMTTKLFWMP